MTVKRKKKLSKKLKKRCKKLKIKLTVKRKGKKVYKSEKVLKMQCKVKKRRKRKIKRRRKFGTGIWGFITNLIGGDNETSSEDEDGRGRHNTSSEDEGFNDENYNDVNINDFADINRKCTNPPNKTDVDALNANTLNINSLKTMFTTHFLEDEQLIKAIDIIHDRKADMYEGIKSIRKFLQKDLVNIPDQYKLEQFNNQSIELFRSDCKRYYIVDKILIPFFTDTRLFNIIKESRNIDPNIQGFNSNDICIGTMDGQISDNFTDKFIKITCDKCKVISNTDDLRYIFFFLINEFKFKFEQKLRSITLTNDMTPDKVRAIILDYLGHYPPPRRWANGFITPPGSQTWGNLDINNPDVHKNKLEQCINNINEQINNSLSNKNVNCAFKHLKYIKQYIDTNDRNKKLKILTNIHGIHGTPINIFSVIDAATSTISGNLTNDNIELLYDNIDNQVSFYPAFDEITSNSQANYHQIKLSIGDDDTFLYSIKPNNIDAVFELNVYPSYRIYNDKIWQKDSSDNVKRTYDGYKFNDNNKEKNFIRQGVNNENSTYGWLRETDNFTQLPNTDTTMNSTDKDRIFTSKGKTKPVYPFELKLPREKVERWVILKIASTRVKFEHVVTTYLNSSKINGIDGNNWEFIQLYPNCTRQSTSTLINNKNIMRLRSKFAVLVKYNTDKYMVICNASPQNPIVAKLTQLIELCTLNVGYIGRRTNRTNSNKILLSIMNYKRIMDSLQYYGLHNQVKAENKKGIFITGDRSCFFQAMFLKNKDDSDIDVYYNNKNEETKCLKFEPSQGNGRFVFGRRRRFGKGPFDSPEREKYTSQTGMSPRTARRPTRSSTGSSTGKPKRTVQRALNLGQDPPNDIFKKTGEQRLKDEYEYMNNSKRIQDSDTRFLKIKKKRAIIKEVTEICGLLEEEFIDYFFTITEKNKVVLKYFLHPVIKYYYKKDDYVKKKLDSILSKDYIIPDEKVSFVGSTEGGSNNNITYVDKELKQFGKKKRKRKVKKKRKKVKRKRKKVKKKRKKVKKKQKKVKRKRKKVKKKQKKVKRKRKT